jgi:hypothetical protein
LYFLLYIFVFLILGATAALRNISESLLFDFAAGCYYKHMNKIPSLGDLSPEQFTMKAIERLRKPPFKGIHSVYSGFNAAFREYYPLLDPVDFTNQLAKDGRVVVRPVRGGVILYKPEDAPEGLVTSDTIKIVTNDKEDILPEDFVLEAIEKLRKPPFKGIHSVYSGFNAAFREYYPLLDPVDFTNQLAADGKVVIRPTRGGVMLYKQEEVSGTTSAENTLKKIIEEPNQK